MRSSTVVLGSMGALAVALSGYSSEPDKRCVDPDSYDAVRGYRVLPPSQCEAPGTGPQAGSAAFPAAATTRAAATAPARHDRGLHDRGLHDRGRQEGGRQDGGRRADGPGTAWYYGGHEERGRAEGGTFIHAAAVERAGFGCDDDDDSSGGGGFGG
ncbi:hypothetical protein FM076_07630 [Streptomyces albus subsp. chlorinus]|nr:hypothetical protein [Streptomyces albus subsp. chlorinus]